MNKTMKIAILLIIIIVIILLIIFGSKVIFAKNDDKNLDSKVISEVEYFESELTNLLNQMNNIKFENYKISIKEIPEESATSESENESKSGSGSNSSDSSSSDSSSSSSSSSSSEGESSNKSEEATQKVTKEYTLKKTGVLTSESNVDWDTIKNKIEELYISISIVTLDLYKINTDQENILGFNSELDNLAIAAKNEDKQKTLDCLATLYSYLPKYIETIKNTDQNYANILKTKSNVFYGYSLLDTDNWNDIDGYNKKAIEEFSNILKNSSFDIQNETTINKIYIDLNELQNAINLKDKEIYLIKYKNLLEQLNNL